MIVTDREEGSLKRGSSWKASWEQGHLNEGLGNGRNLPWDEPWQDFSRNVKAKDPEMDRILIFRILRG